MLITILIFVITNIIVKHLSRDVGVIPLSNLVNLIVSIPFALILIKDMIFNQEYKAWELGIGIIGGVFNYLTSTLQPYVITYGKAGPSDAIIQTTSVFHVFLDSIIYHRNPTFIQCISLFIILTSLFLLLFHNKIWPKKDQRN